MADLERGQEETLKANRGRSEEERNMLVNKSGRMLVIGRIRAKNGEALSGIPYTADERKGVEKFVKKGYIVEVAAEEPKAEPTADVKVEPVVEAKVEPIVEAADEEPKVEPIVEEPKAEPEAKPAYAKYSRRRKKADVEEQVTEDGGRADG